MVVVGTAAAVVVEVVVGGIDVDVCVPPSATVEEKMSLTLILIVKMVCAITEVY